MSNSYPEFVTFLLTELAGLYDLPARRFFRGLAIAGGQRANCDCDEWNVTHNGLPADITPFKLKRFLKQAQSMLGLSKGAVQYLEFAIESCQSADFQHGRITETSMPSSGPNF